MLTPVTLPCYPSIHQSENCAQADHLFPSLTWPLKCLPETNQEVWAFEALAALDSLLDACNEPCTSLHHNPGSYLGFTACRQADPSLFG